MNILLNGVGRIGKSILRIANSSNSLNITTINELNTNIENIAYSINYDSTYGRFEDRFSVVDDTIVNSTSKIKILNYQSLFDIDFKTHNIDIVIDASGSITDTEELKKLDLNYIFLTHPNKNADANIVLGVNEKEIDLESCKIISTSSCNATALLPVLKCIDDNYTIDYGDITTVHPLLNHQKTLDGGCIGSHDRDVHCNFEFGRSAVQNIIPSQTTTIEACSYILSHINSENISSSSLRVPTATVGAINITMSVQKECSKDEVISLLDAYQENQEFDIIYNNTQALVSSDFVAERYTSIIDHRFTEVKKNKMIKLVVWYDNEWGYASKVVDIVGLINK